MCEIDDLRLSIAYASLEGLAQASQYGKLSESSKRLLLRWRVPTRQIYSENVAYVRAIPCWFRCCSVAMDRTLPLPMTKIWVLRRTCKIARTASGRSCCALMTWGRFSKDVSFTTMALIDNEIEIEVQAIAFTEDGMLTRHAEYAVVVAWIGLDVTALKRPFHPNVACEQLLPVLPAKITVTTLAGLSGRIDHLPCLTGVTESKVAGMLDVSHVFASLLSSAPFLPSPVVLESRPKSSTTTAMRSRTLSPLLAIIGFSSQSPANAHPQNGNIQYAIVNTVHKRRAASTGPNRWK
nr:hypothetical protein CFP56_21590 [Quercus suber]